MESVMAAILEKNDYVRARVPHELKSQAENIYSPILRTQDINHWDYEIGKIENQLAYKKIQEFYKNHKPKITTRILNKMKKILGV